MSQKIKNILDFSTLIFSDEVTKTTRDTSYYYRKVTSGNLDENAALFESYHAVSTTGNIYALFEELCKSKPNMKKYWVYKKNSPLLDEIKKNSNTVLVEYESRQYFKILATAKYLFNDTSFMPYFIKQPNQIYTNTWHGTPLKTLGLDIINHGQNDHKNIQRNLLATDYLMMPNKFTADKLLTSHHLNGIFPGKVFDTGNPRMDLNKKNPIEMRKKYGLDLGKKYILYAPTWKKGVDETTDEDVYDLVKQLELLQNSVPENTVVLLKSHYFIYEKFVSFGLEEKVVPDWVDTNEYLTTVDALITDYSSIFFDFLPFEKPIYFYMEDLEYYQNTRGLYLDISDLPGEVYYSISDLCEGISVDYETYLSTHQENIKYYLDNFCYLDNGASSERIINILFEKNSIGTEELHFISNKEVLLFYGGGFYNNGITSSLINLSNSINYDKYEVIIIEYPNASSEIKTKNLARLNKNVKVIFKFGEMPHSFLDGVSNKLLMRRGLGGRFVNEKRVKRYNNLDKYRTLGNLKPDYYIDFGGYNKAMNSFFALSNDSKKIVFLHNLMKAEYDKVVNNRFIHKWNLKVIFSLYNHFDKIVSVSESVNEQNKIEIKKVQPNLNTSKMYYCENTIDGEAILENVSHIREINKTYTMPGKILVDKVDEDRIETFSYVPKLNKEDINFVTVARLSPEKNHSNTIIAFAKIVKKYPHAKLHLIGSGPEKSNLDKLVLEKSLSNNVFFYNHLNNPFYFVKQCDCFVLFSNYEGQGLSIIESQILGVPVLGTNVSGIKSVLEDSEQDLLVPCTIDGIVEGFERFIKGKIKADDFDYKEYNEKAYSQFENLLK